MISGELRGRGYVGVAPGTTTIHFGDQPPAVNPAKQVTYEEYLAKDIELRQEALKLQRRGELWGRIATFATASLTTLAVLAAVGAWWRTGKLQVSR